MPRIKSNQNEAGEIKEVDQLDPIIALQDKIKALEEKDKENQEKLKMLYEIADKGRVFNYENNKKEKKPTLVNLSKYADGIIVGWRTVKDELLKHPTTGLTMGEVQEYEVLVLDNEDKTKKHTISGYPAFSSARYNERVEAQVTGRKEEWDGAITLDVVLPDGRKISLDAKYVN